ncbi:hypothetical protein [Roseimaritima ulvae]|uniref:Uncharacterized protein n=1 Tax=Roseimaritima ulvae TaxID=980254 RepID=A0A5B9QVN4_9BACT|nr:hypothetical protein [Roseimaritima ulvae]QEG42022.1 hypothetical protein UC8_40510 [Roseimaritima ulvae]
MLRYSLTLLASMTVVLSSLQTATAEDAAAKGKTIAVFDAGTITTPAAWRVVRPKVSIIEHEFAATVEDEAGKARVTMMAATGSVDANIARWKNQFKLAGEDAVKQEKTTVDGNTIYLVNLDGAFKEKTGGPFAPGPVIERPDYAMSGAIIVDEEGRKYFIKMIGPGTIVKAHREAFGKMVKGLKTK